MLNIKKILVPTDFSAGSKEALWQAVLIAEQYKAEVILFHVTVLFNEGIDMGLDAKGWQSMYEKASADVAEKLGSNIPDTIPDTVHVYHDQVRDVSVHDAIIDYADNQDIDLIVMATHGRKGISRFMIGSVAELVVRRSEQPVLTVHNDKKVDETGAIVVPIDFSGFAEESLYVAIKFAEKWNVPVHAVHVLETHLHPAFYQAEVYSPIEPTAGLKGKIEAEMRKRYDKIHGDGKEVDIHFHVLEGTPVSKLTEFISGIDDALVVIATHGLTGLKHFVFGSVAEQVVRQSESPVLALKPFGLSLVHEMEISLEATK